MHRKIDINWYMGRLTSDNVVLKDTSKSFSSFMLKPVTDAGSKCASSQVTCDINTSAVASPGRQSSSDGMYVCCQQSSFFSEFDVRSCAVKGTGRAWPTKSEDMHVDWE